MQQCVRQGSRAAWHLLCGSQVLSIVVPACSISSNTTHDFQAPGRLFDAISASFLAQTRAKYTLAKRSEQEEADLQHQIDELYHTLKALGLTRKFVERIAIKRVNNQTRLATAGELQERITTLWDITHAHDLQQQEALVKKLYHIPELLNLLPDTLRTKAGALQQLLQDQLGLSQALVQALIVTQPSVLMFKPALLAHKMQETAQRLGMGPEEVHSLWLKQRSLINMSVSGLDDKLSELGELLELERLEVARLVASQPAVLASSMETVKHRLAVLQECFSDWSTKQIGQALVQYPSALTYRPETLHYKWRVVNAYAALHPPSMEQLQQRQQLPAVFNFFTRTAERMELLEYLMALQQVLVGDSSSSSSSSSSRRRREGSSSSSSSDEVAGAAADSSSSGPSTETCAADELPLLLFVTNVSTTRFALFVDERYPGFRAWQAQQQQQKQKKHTSQ